MSYASKLLTANKLGSVIGYLQTLKKCNIDISKLQQSINVENKKNLSALPQKTNKKELQLDELVAIVGTSELKQFLKKEMKFNNYISMIEQLSSINITTYEDLQMTIEKNQFIKRCRSNGKKILSSKQIKAIMYIVLEKLKQLKQLANKTEQKTQEINIFDIDVSTIIIKETQKTTIEQLKNKRINLSNLMTLTTEQGLEDTDDLEKEIKELDTKINDYYMSLSEQQCLTEDIEELIQYMNTIKGNTEEVDRVKSIISKYSELNNMIVDNVYGQNYEETVVSCGYAQFDKELENIISKYDKEFSTEDKQQDKTNFIQEQNKMIKRTIVSTLKSLDSQFNTNSTKQLQSLLITFKSQLQKLVKPEIFKQIINVTKIKGSTNKLLFSLIMEVAKIFTTVFYIQNNKIDTGKLYSNISQFKNTEINKDKIVLVKSMNQKGKYIKECENQVYVELIEGVVRVEKNDITFLDSWLNKNVKVIGGNKKGMCGTVYLEKEKYVMITKDFYGRNNLKATPLLKSLKVLKTDIKLFEEQYETEIDEQLNIKYSDLYSFYKNQTNCLYPMVKFNFFKNNTTGNYKHFNSTYDIALQLYNNMLENQKIEYNTLVEQKIAFNNNKKALIELKNTKQNKAFITMKKQLLKDSTDIKKLARQLKNMGITKTILKTEELENKSSAYDHYVKTDKQVKRKKFRITKQLIKTVVAEEITRVDDIMAGLFD